MTTLTTATSRTKSRKPAYKPMVKQFNRAAGQYLVSSETYGGHIFWEVDLVRGTCQCEGSAKWGKVCRHLKAARLVHDGIEAMRARSLVVGGSNNPHAGSAVGLREAFGMEA